ncbi:Biopterin-dependent aromatic amino acid hydroxylase [Dictyocaulus viviparus]|uniref:Biopterin-dependent aromatic amino acid hydroxylase n=1 Tax=Dictyocaulus viviparus TaxID=29172 RepID=A0A0D8XVS2_DICVI|nr:Biopterin-dependent aromatic amino acid hydroxylase [Dictyocaulus viviparus]
MRQSELWFPRHISELDKCSNCFTKYDPVSDPRHPGYQDEAYIARRNFLNSIASGYKYGEPIPIVEYTDEEHAIWKSVYNHLSTLRESYTCLAYRRNLRMLEDEGILSPEKIPQIRDVNEFLQKKTGFVLRPCAGLLSARDFLTSLAFRVFQTTMYVRHSAKPHHSPEPDLIHELLGHVPMFADPMVAQLSQEIGLMSLGASDEEIEKLATVYWFIIEFGLCKEDGQLKAIGAGLVSAYGELLHACSDSPEHRDFDPALTAVQKYEDSDYQPVYFVAHSIKDALVKLRNYALTLDRDFVTMYDPFTRSIELAINASWGQPGCAAPADVEVVWLSGKRLCGKSGVATGNLRFDKEFGSLMTEQGGRLSGVIRHISQLAPAYERLHADIGATTLVNEKLSMKGF